MGTVPILLSINDSIGNRHPRLNRIKTRERERSLEGIYECLRERMPRNGEWKERIFVNSFNFFHYFFSNSSNQKKKKKSKRWIRKIVAHRGKKRKYLFQPGSNPLLMEKLGGQATLRAEIFSHASLIVHRLKVRGRTCNPVAHACPVSRCFARASTHAMSRCHGLTQLTRVATSPSLFSRVDRAHSAQIETHTRLFFLVAFRETVHLLLPPRWTSSRRTTIDSIDSMGESGGVGRRISRKMRWRVLGTRVQNVDLERNSIRKERKDLEEIRARFIFVRRIFHSSKVERG